MESLGHKWLIWSTHCRGIRGTWMQLQAVNNLVQQTLSRGLHDSRPSSLQILVTYLTILVYLSICVVALLKSYSTWYLSLMVLTPPLRLVVQPWKTLCWQLEQTHWKLHHKLWWQRLKKNTIVMLSSASGHQMAYVSNENRPWIFSKWLNINVAISRCKMKAASFWQCV